MPEYLIYFNQQWVGDHTEEWFRGRGPLAMVVVDEMKAAGVYVFAGGLEEEDGPVYSADPTSGTVMVSDGPYVETKEFLGGFALVDVADDDAAKVWAGKVAEACGWPHEVRRFKPRPKGRVTPTVSESASFVPTDFVPPTSFTAGEFRLEPLGPEHNQRDYTAWTSSMEHIRRSPGFREGNWPREMSVDENRADLERHARDFADRTGFTFTVLDPSDDVVGCVYVYPARDGVHDADVQSWVRESEATLDDAFRRAIADWLTSDAWPFEQPLYAPLLT